MTTTTATDRLAVPLAGRTEKLAIDGGSKTRSTPFPPRRLFDEEEKQAAIAVFDESIAQGEAFGYNGPHEEAYCREFSEFLGGGYADGVSSGSTAIYVALRSLDIEPFTEVIVPPISDMGGFMPVPLMNCIPIPADAVPDGFNAGPEQIERMISPLTRAIIVAHIAGHPCDMDPIMEIARSRGIPVVEDCAQSHGATYKGRQCGSLGDVAAFSTMSGKHHATAAQGGVVFTKNKDAYWRIRQLSDRGKPFGLENQPTNVMASLNFNSNDLAAAVGRVQLRKLPKSIESRQKTAAKLAEALKATRTVRLNTGLAHAKSAYWFLVLKLDLDALRVSKAQFVQAVIAEGIGAQDTYIHTLIDGDWYKQRRVFGASGYPWTCPLYKGDATRQFTIPNARRTNETHFAVMGFHERWTDQEVTDVVRAIQKVEAAYVK